MAIDLEGALRQHFGFDSFRPGQREVVEHLIAGRSAAAVFPTGSGKSLCYQLPAMLLEGVTLVISPLIALMKDQIDALQSRGIAAQRLDSTLSADEYREVMNDLRGGRLRMLYVAPERFNNERFREAILRTRVALFAVDEAHCISEWGHNFRPDYLKLVEFSKSCGAERVLGLTATATQKVLRDMCRAFEITPECAICTGFYRENLTLLTTPAASEQRDSRLVERLRERAAGPTIVYVTLQRTAMEVASQLTAAGFVAKPYHAGLPDDRRSEVQDWFLSSDSGIVVATIAFGMGVDKPNIRYIYHYNLPKSLENYSQEIGRAGRDGDASVCEMLVCADDLSVLENFAYGDTPTLASVVNLLNDLFSLGDEFDVSYYELSSAHDIRILVVRTLLTYLELLGYVEGGTPFYSKYQFKPLMSSQAILSEFAGERQRFLSDVLRQATKAKTWFTIDVDRAAAALGSTRDRIVRSLDYLGEQKMLEIKAQGVRNRYRLRKPCDDVHALAARLHGKSVQRQEREIARLREVLELAGHDGCLVGRLCGYFGESLAAPCGHCSWCLNGHKPLQKIARSTATLDDGLLDQVRLLAGDYPNVLASPHDFARLLCGTPSPKLSKAKLSSHRLFGAAADVPFEDVLSHFSKAPVCS